MALNQAKPLKLATTRNLTQIDKRVIMRLVMKNKLAVERTMARFKKTKHWKEMETACRAEGKNIKEMAGIIIDSVKLWTFEDKQFAKTLI